MSGDPELTCKEFIDIAYELAERIKQTGSLPDNFEYTTYAQDIAHIRHELTNYDLIWRELEPYRSPEILSTKPLDNPQYLRHVCGDDDPEGLCVNEEVAHEVIKQAANRIAREIYRAG